MKNLKTLLTLISLLSLGASANALIIDMDYVDFDKVGPGGAGVVLNANNLSVSGTFDIVNDDYDAGLWNGGERDKWGFDSEKERVVDAAFRFVFMESTPEGVLMGSVLFSLGGLAPLGGVTPVVEGVEVAIGKDYFGDAIYASILANIDDDGMLDWGVTLLNDKESITLKKVMLGVNVEPVSDSGTTFSLLGFGVFAFALIRRRMC